MDKEQILNKISENIRIERLKKRYSQEKLSDMADITQKYLNYIENKKANPSIIVVIKICNALDITLNDLLKYLNLIYLCYNFLNLLQNTYY